MKQTAKTGARRRYCDNRCRRRAQWARDRARRAPAPRATAQQSAAIASDIQGLAQQLQDEERRHAPLEVRFELSKLLNREVRCYMAASVQEERAAGEVWDVIGEAAGVSAASARASWSETKVSAILASRPPVRSAVRGASPRNSAAERPLDWAFTRPSGRLQRAAARVLENYLTGLLRSSLVPVDDVAVRAGLPRDAVTLSLGGELIASWPVTFMLTALLGGQPEVLRTVWETASGERELNEHTAVEATRCVGDILRVLHVAADEPDTETLAALSQLAPDTIADALDGTRIPDWSETERLAVALSAEPSIVQPFWECWSTAETDTKAPRHVA
ncbi:hypothetical protein AMK17_19810 [Streptomyces sp. CB00072]|uniref:hypothetical protein n=1 Tax=Streptomyces sp. CB00072 TaxID=1703928 RepID=UPI00093FE4F2|nr:hypothetical protein [Streptomyces sp. CB00072]OKI55309.1 hypothetical protein AMK17_19810 [Streptomyces sp. CB00072]